MSWSEIQGSPRNRHSTGHSLAFGERVPSPEWASSQRGPELAPATYHHLPREPPSSRAYGRASPHPTAAHTDPCGKTHMCKDGGKELPGDCTPDTHVHMLRNMNARTRSPPRAHMCLWVCTGGCQYLHTCIHVYTYVCERPHLRIQESLWTPISGLKDASQELVCVVLMRKGQGSREPPASLPLEVGTPQPQPLGLGRAHNPLGGGSLSSGSSLALPPSCVALDNPPPLGPTYSVGYRGLPDCNHLFVNQATHPRRSPSAYFLISGSTRGQD